MSSTNSEGPPLKKRRFFREKTIVTPCHSNQDPENPNERDPLLNSKSNESQSLSQKNHDPQNVTTPQPDISPDHETIKFDEVTFESLIGENVSPQMIKLLREASGDRMEQAVNLYFDGFCSRTKLLLNSKTQTTLNKCLTSGSNLIQQYPEKKKSARSVTSLTDSMPEYRYIGAFGCEGWATRSGVSLLKHGDPVRIERQKIKPLKPSIVKAKLGGASTQATLKPSMAISRRIDVLVRFTNFKGEEIGRLPQSYADWISCLLDQKICKFEGICVYAPEKFRSGDTLFLQLRCLLLRTAFHVNNSQLPENRTTGLFEEKESYEEKLLRQKQASLVKLFKEINLLPTQTSGSDENHNRERLLQAVEITEQHDKSKKKAISFPDATNSSPPIDGAEDGKELEQDQLDALYEKAQSFDFSAPAAEPSDTFALNLRHYQKQALHWMISKEKDMQDPSREQSIHPLWEEYTWPIKDVEDKELPRITNQDKFYVNMYSGELSLEFPVQRQNNLGGILADEMGLGKTIEMISLIHSHKSDTATRLKISNNTPSSLNQVSRHAINSKNINYAPSTTLVVAPMSLLAQWQSETERASKEGTLKSMVYYGSDKISNLQSVCCEVGASSAPDVIITSYGVVSSEFSQLMGKNGDKRSINGLFSVKYFRVILDEAHHIKNRQSKSAKACYEIEADHRWALTGTPVVNRLEDLFSLVRFLRVEPWSNFSFWRTFITVPFESKDVFRALDVVQTVLEPLVLRRTKDMKTPSGEALVPLPPKTIEFDFIELPKPEREVYDHVLTRAKQTFEANVEAGTVMKAYTNLFTHIMRLRQSCCHPVLIRNPIVLAEEDKAAEAADAATGLSDDMDLQSLIDRFTAESNGPTDTNIFGARALQLIQNDAENECPICSEEPIVERIITSCWHSACKSCLLDYMNRQTEKGERPRCVTCREFLETRNLFEVVKEEEDSNMPPRYRLQRLGATSSAKVVALIGHLKRLKKDKPGTKSVVFSQFTSFLSLIEPALSQASIPFLRLDGSMAQKTRADVLHEFASSRKGTVLLLSLRAGGVGLNLTMAKHVFMMDPWWSFAVESQAIDRVHRMGQTDEVKVCRFIVQNSVEERMLKIQERKKFM